MIPLDPRCGRGYTMVELVMVIILASILAAVALPKLDIATNIRDDIWRDGLLSGLRYAQKTAVSHRRLVCATVADTQVTLQIASANPATACDTDLTGPSGAGVFARSGSGSTKTTVSPAGIVYFQPDGRVTTDGAGTTVASRTLTITGVATAISIVGETGYAE